MIARGQTLLLRQLAALYGVQTAYYDVAHRRVQASPESLLAGLRALGAPVETMQDVPTALRERRQSLWRRTVDAVAVTWGDGMGGSEIRLPMALASEPMVCHLSLETGETQSWTEDLGRLSPLQTADIEGTSYVAKRLAFAYPLPWGYHGLRLEVRGKTYESMVISAPCRAYPESPEPTTRTWGVFLPLYAAHSQRSWGGGDFTDLEALTDWVVNLGGGVVATLPLLAAFLDEPFDPSPYAPVSRLFWNEFYLDVQRIPELMHCPEAVALLTSPEVGSELQALRASPVVDYRRQMALKRRVLEALSRSFFAGTSSRQGEFQKFVEASPHSVDYACFRATMERQRAAWAAWPQPLRDGRLQNDDYDEEAKRYHLYVQWLAHEQLGALVEKARQTGQGLYLDLPLGVHRDGYDVWRERQAFAVDASGGAPPDAVFTNGQNWSFPPLHPERVRQQGYRYVIAYLRHHLQYAGLLRIDHVLGLHRLFWIPQGLEPRQGVYVRYPAEELYAILSLESHRHHSLIVGENLGTVPYYVNPSMTRHNLHRMYVIQYELVPHPRRVLRAVTPDTVASVNTHDMSPFAAFWQGHDIADRRQLGLLDEEGARREQETRQALKTALGRLLERQGWLTDAPDHAYAVLRACLAFLSASPARVVLANLEDLWQEIEPQNVPGTQDERLNWRRKARYSVETLCQMPQVLEALQEIDHLRKQGNREGRQDDRSAKEQSGDPAHQR